MSPTVLKTKNLSVRIYRKDHAPPHVHVRGPGSEAKFRLKDMEFFFWGFSLKALKQIKSFLKEREYILLEAWDESQK